MIDRVMQERVIARGEVPVPQDPGEEEGIPVPSRCIIFCRKITGHLFELKRGVAILADPLDGLHQDPSVRVYFTKVVLVVEDDNPENEEPLSLRENVLKD